MNVYTLPIIDDDGSITGNPGAVIVASRVLEFVDVPSLGRLKVSQCGSSRLLNADTEVYKLPDGSVYRKTRIRTAGGWPFTVWERTE